MKTYTNYEVEQLIKIKGNKEPYKMEGHSWTILKHVGKQYCKNCGLVRLNNPFTVWCIDKGCNNADHPQYQTIRAKLTKQEWS